MGGLEIKCYTSASGFYADDVNTVSGIAYIIKKKREPLLVASKEFGPEVNAEKTKYMVISPD
jgi:hypothetical protein